MQKITYRYSALSKQTWFYAGALYLALLSAVYILVAACRLEGYYERMNLTVNLLANGAGMAFFYLLSLGHNVCFSEYDVAPGYMGAQSFDIPTEAIAGALHTDLIR